MALFYTLRLAAFGTVLAFALIVLGISAYWLSLIGGYVSIFSTPASFALAVAVITWASMFPMLLIGMLRQGSFLSWVAVELGVCGLMWVLWLATAAHTTSLTMGYSLNCDLISLDPASESICRQFQAVQAFSWLNWLIIFAYIVLLIVYIVKASNAGRSIWTSDVADLVGPAEGDNATTLAPSMSTANNSGKPPMSPQPYSPQLQYNQPPQQYPQGVSHV